MLETVISNLRHTNLWHQITSLRNQVFVIEQGLNANVVSDQYDESCIHIGIIDKDMILAACRVRKEGNVGIIERLIVSKKCRNEHLGTKLIESSINYLLSEGVIMITLCSQEHLTELYKKFGFEENGSSFILYGIPHIKMVRYSVKKEKIYEEKR